MFSGRRREETEPVWLGLETRIQQSGAEKIPFLLIAASARCFLSSLAVPGPLQLGTVSIWDVFSARFLFCHASGVLLPSPRTLQTSPPRGSVLFPSTDTFLVLLLQPSCSRLGVLYHSGTVTC